MSILFLQFIYFVFLLLYIDLFELIYICILNLISPFVLFRNSYLTEVSKLSWGSKQLTLDGMNNGAGRVVFDSGSSYTYFPRLAYSDLVATVSSFKMV